MLHDNFEREDLLTGHLDALILDRPTDEFFRGLIRPADGETLELLHLANQLNLALMPVEPSAAFLAALKADFVSPEPPALALRWRALPTQYRLAARLGGGALTLGLVLIAVRRALTVLSGLRGTQKRGETALPASIEGVGAGVKVTP